MKRVLIITYYWPPAGGPGVQRTLKFVKYLPEFGWEPVILTVSNGEYPAIDESLLAEIDPKLKIYKSKTFEPNKFYKGFVGIEKEKSLPVAILTDSGGSWKKRFSHWIRANLFIPDAKIGWYFSGVSNGMEIIRKEKPSLIFSSSPPPTVHLIARSLTRKSKLKWVADFRDPWTRIYHYGHLNRTALTKKIDKKLEDKTLSSADKVTVVSNGFFESPSTVKLVELTNGFDSSDLSAEMKYKRSEQFTIAYMGSLKPRQYVGGFFEILKKLVRKNNYTDKIKLEFIGLVDPGVKQKIEAKNIGIEIIYSGYSDHKTALKKIASADLLLLIIGKSYISKEILSGKLFEYLMMKKPILAFGPKDGKAAELLRKTGAGEMFDYSDISGAEKFLSGIFDNWQKNIDTYGLNIEEINKYERRELTRKLANIFKELT